MSTTLGFNDNDLTSLKQNFYYYSNIQVDEEIVKNLNFSGFSESDGDHDFIIESTNPFMIRIDDEILEVENIDTIKDILSFKRDLARTIKLNKSMHLEAHSNSVDSEAGFLLEKVYHDVNDGFVAALFKLNEIKNEFDIVVIKKDESHLFRVKEDYCFEDDDNYYLLNAQSEEGIRLIPSIALFIKLVEVNENKVNESTIGVSDLINKLDFPVVIINDDHIVSYHNDHFAKLGITPSSLLSNLSSGWIDISDQKYKILSSKVFNLQTICLIKQEFNYSKSHSELGIITSSIAHELNNPLAGILAAINMLELEDWAEEDAIILNEMKASANRCRNLISTFLGFSRLKEQQGFDQSFGSILGQAISLLSNRKIESGIAIETSISNELEMKSICGASLPIILYLILSEMMTLKNHELLIEKGDSTIICSFSLREKDIVLNVKNLNLEGQKSKILSRLIGHLLGLENSHVDILGQDIIIYNLL